MNLCRMNRLLSIFLVIAAFSQEPEGQSTPPAEIVYPAKLQSRHQQTTESLRVPDQYAPSGWAVGGGEIKGDALNPWFIQNT